MPLLKIENQTYSSFPHLRRGNRPNEGLFWLKVTQGAHLTRQAQTQPLRVALLIVERPSKVRAEYSMTTTPLTPTQPSDLYLPVTLPVFSLASWASWKFLALLEVARSTLHPPFKYPLTYPTLSYKLCDLGQIVHLLWACIIKVRGALLTLKGCCESHEL